MTPAVPVLLLGLMLMAAPIAATAQTAAVPFGRSAADAGQPVEIAPIFVLLASDEASYITGEVYGATGGQGTG